MEILDPRTNIRNLFKIEFLNIFLIQQMITATLMYENLELNFTMQ